MALGSTPTWGVEPVVFGCEYRIFEMLGQVFKDLHHPVLGGVETFSTSSRSCRKRKRSQTAFGSRFARAGRFS